MAFKLPTHQFAKGGIDRLKHRRSKLDKRDVEPASRKGVRHFEADVAAPDDQRGRARSRSEMRVDGKTVVHRMQAKDTGRVDAVNLCLDGSRPRAQDQTIVREFARFAGVVPHQKDLPVRVDALCSGVEEKPESCLLELAERAMCKASPVGNFSAQVEGEPADAVVRKGVGHDERDLHFGCHLSNPKAGTNSGVTSTHDHDVHRFSMNSGGEEQSFTIYR
jgi:hypothetical protein